MSGELINTQRFVDGKNIFKRGTGGFSSKSINEIFDVDSSGDVSGVERDLMSSVGAINALDSISPAVAFAFRNENFRIQQGCYLTENQKVSRDKLVLAINKSLMLDRLKAIPEKRIDEDQPNTENGDLDTGNLQEDIKHRQYLDRSEINNGV